VLPTCESVKFSKSSCQEIGIRNICYPVPVTGDLTLFRVLVLLFVNVDEKVDLKPRVVSVVFLIEMTLGKRHFRIAAALI
jgi:hypothetical protein